MFNAVDVSVGLSKEDPMYSKKKVYLDKSGRGVSNVRFPLQASRYPSELVDFLRLLLVESDDLGMQTLDRVDFNEPLSPSLERRVLTTIISICESYLERYPTTEEEDNTLIADRAMFATLSRQQRMAVKLRASEKRILKASIKAVEDELAKLPAIVSLSGEIAAAGRSFDTMGTKTTNAAKGIMDLVDVKGPPKAAAKAAEEPGIAERRRRRRTSGDK
jgi:histone-lysine N-methyltransferase SETD3